MWNFCEEAKIWANKKNIEIKLWFLRNISIRQKLSDVIQYQTEANFEKKKFGENQMNKDRRAYLIQALKFE